MNETTIKPADQSFNRLRRFGLDDFLIDVKRKDWQELHGQITRGNGEIARMKGFHLHEPIAQAVLNSAVKAGVLNVAELDNGGKRYTTGPNWS